MLVKLFWVLADMINTPSVQEVNHQKENHHTKNIKNGITKRRKTKRDGIILPVRHHRAGIHRVSSSMFIHNIESS